MNHSPLIQQELIKLNLDQSMDPTWLADCSNYLSSQNKLTSLHFSTQLLYSDLKDYSTGYQYVGELLQNSTNQREGKDYVPVHHDIGYFFQIEDIEEIGSSSQTMLDAIEEITDKLVQTGNDNLNLQQENLPAIPRKMLKYTLTDGLHLFYAIETSHIPNINLFSPVGGKLFVRKAYFARGLLKLSPEHVSFLGGYVTEMNEIAPLYRIASKCRKRLGIDEKKGRKFKTPLSENTSHAIHAQSKPPDQKIITHVTSMQCNQEFKQEENTRRESTSHMDQIYQAFNHEELMAVSNNQTSNQNNRELKPISNNAAYSDDEYGLDDFPENLSFYNNLDVKVEAQEQHMTSPVFNICSVSKISNEFNEQSEIIALPSDSLGQNQSLKNGKRGRKASGIIILSSSPIQKKSKKVDSPPIILKSLKNILQSSPGAYKVWAKAVTCHKIAKLPNRNLFHMPLTLKDDSGNTHTFPLQSNIIANLCNFPGPEELAAARENDKAVAKMAGLAVLNTVKNSAGYFHFTVLNDTDIDEEEGRPKISISSLP